MAVQTASVQKKVERATPPNLTLHRFTLDGYRRLVESGIIAKIDNCVLIDGFLIERSRVNPPHAATSRNLLKWLPDLVSEEWVFSPDLPIELPASDSSPRPDVSICRGPDSRYETRHPQPEDVALVIEVADSSLAEDRTTMLEMYALDKIPVYWIVNLVERQVEVYTHPKGGKKPGYRRRLDFASGSKVPVVLGGVEVAAIDVDAILPAR